MDEILDQKVRSWLERIAVEKSTTLVDVARQFAKEEIANRLQFYPAMQDALKSAPFETKTFAQAAKKAHVFQGRFDAIQLSSFTSHAGSNQEVTKLVDDFPERDVEAATRIQAFVEQCLSLGYGESRANAGLLASTILTVAFPKRFVDFRKAWWEGFATELGTERFEGAHPTYGEMIVEAGHFAAQVVAAETFRELWPNGEPMWTIAGICWKAKDRKRH